MMVIMFGEVRKHQYGCYVYTYKKKCLSKGPGRFSVE
jgi:hypothetical protein